MHARLARPPAARAADQPDTPVTRHVARMAMVVAALVSVGATTWLTRPATTAAGTDGPAVVARDPLATPIAHSIRTTGTTTVGAVSRFVSAPTIRVHEHRTVEIAPPIEWQRTDLLPQDSTEIHTVGVAGRHSATVEITIHDGTPITESTISTHVVEPTPTIVRIGTSTSPAARRNWAALARCESGGDPTIVSRSGRYHGLYQFDRQTWSSVGGVGLPSEASADEQTRRAMALYEQRGAQPWPTCGRHL